MLGTTRDPTARPLPGGARVRVCLLGCGSHTGRDDLADLALGGYRHDESLFGACEPDVLQVLHRHASRWGGLASLRRIGGPFQHPLDHPTSLQSPRVNPVEHIWDELREKYFGNRAFPSLDALIEVLCQGLNELSNDSVRLRSLTGFPHLLNRHL